MLPGQPQIPASASLYFRNAALAGPLLPLPSRPSSCAFPTKGTKLPPALTLKLTRSTPSTRPLPYVTPATLHLICSPLRAPTTTVVIEMAPGLMLRIGHTTPLTGGSRRTLGGAHRRLLRLRLLQGSCEVGPWFEVTCVGEKLVNIVEYSRELERKRSGQRCSAASRRFASALK